MSSSPSLSLQTAAQLLHSLEQRRQRSLLETRVAPFDRLLGRRGDPGLRGGLARGSLVELAGTRSSGRFAIALAALAAATGTGEAAALVDLGDHLEPRSADAAGLDLKRLLWVRPRTLREAVMAAEMVVSAGFAVVVLDLGSRPLPLRRSVPSAEGSLPTSVWVRLARAAQAHHCALLLLSPTPLRPPAASAIVTASGGRGLWMGEGDDPKLLTGIAARLSVLHRRDGFSEASGALSLGVRDQIDGREGA